MVARCDGEVWWQGVATLAWHRGELVCCSKVTMFKSFTFCKYGDDGAVNNEEDGPLADLAGTHGLEMLGHHPVDYVDDHPTARARARARARAVG